MASGTLWRNRDFGLLWAAESVSRLGSQVSILALPLVAIVRLKATPFEVGALASAETFPFLLVGLPAGAWIDRMAKRPILVAADAGRLVLLGSIPLAAALDVLTLAQLLVVAFLTGVLTVFFDVAYQSYLPSLVDRDQLVEGNAKLSATEAVGTVAGPGVGGLLISAVGAAGAVAADALSFAFSGLCLLAIRSREVVERVAKDERPPLRTEIAEGLRWVARERHVRAIAAGTATSNLGSGVLFAVLTLHLSRELGWSAGRIGIVFALGNVGGIVGASVSSRAGKRLGVGPTIVGSLAISGVGGLLMAAATGHAAAAFVVAGQTLFGFAGIVYNVSQVSLRQALCPPRLRGRMNASVRFIIWGTLPIGGLLGGGLGEAIGLRPTMFVGGIVGLVAFVPILASPVRHLRTIPDAADDEQLPADAVLT